MSEPLSTADATFGNDGLLPSQFYNRPAGPYAAERVLWLNVLEDAIRCVQRCPTEFIDGASNQGCWDSMGMTSRRRRQGIEDRAWFASDDTAIGSFLWLCDVLSTDTAPIDPAWLRSRLAEGVKLTRRPPVHTSERPTVVRTRVRRAR